MKNSEVKVGMKVVPHAKTAGFNFKRGLDNSVEWKRAQNRNQPFLFVNGWEGSNVWRLCHRDVEKEGGDYFNAKDFEPYEEYRLFRFDGYHGQGEKEFPDFGLVEGQVYPTRNICDYQGDPDLQPDAEFLVNGTWDIQDLCFFTEVTAVDFPPEPSALDLAIMDASAAELEQDFLN